MSTGTTGSAVSRVVRMLGVGTGATAAAVYQPMLLLVLAAGAATLIAVLVAGVLLPAVWSRKSARRRAAVAVLDRLLKTRSWG
jgi:hypothetical protein